MFSNGIALNVYVRICCFQATVVDGVYGYFDAETRAPTVP